MTGEPVTIWTAEFPNAGTELQVTSHHATRTATQIRMPNQHRNGAGWTILRPDAVHYTEADAIAAAIEWADHSIALAQAALDRATTRRAALDQYLAETTS
jgi:hypothetical protein